MNEERDTHAHISFPSAFNREMAIQLAVERNKVVALTLEGFRVLIFPDERYIDWRTLTVSDRQNVAEWINADARTATNRIIRNFKSKMRTFKWTQTQD